MQPLDDASARTLAESLVSATNPQREALVAKLVTSAAGDPFLLAALAREAEATGLGHDLADVEAYFAQMAEFGAGRAPRPAPLEPKPLAR